MKTFITALALATLVAFPAFAQSYDPDLGTGNIAASSESPSYGRGHQQDQSAFARVVPRGSRSAQGAYAAVTPFGAPALERNGANMTAARAASIRECSGLAASFRQPTWGNMDSHQYRTCMAQRGHAE
jgi:hypothetical protein